MAADSMKNTMTIGDFSRATRLSAKALRFYHQAGVLEPAWVDPVNGYRVYSVDQIADAQVVRHFRALDMPVEVVRQVLAATAVADRNALIADHLVRMEAQLERTAPAVSSLRSLLVPAKAPIDVEHRSLPATPALVIQETIHLADLGGWYDAAMAELDQAAVVAPVAGPRGGVWSTELFLEERGTAMLFIPVAAPADCPRAVGRVQVDTLPAVDLAVATHRGADDTIGEVYAALGEYVARHALGVDGPIREFYLQRQSADGGAAVTEIGWPIFRTGR